MAGHRESIYTHNNNNIITNCMAAIPQGGHQQDSYSPQGLGSLLDWLQELECKKNDLLVEDQIS